MESTTQCQGQLAKDFPVKANYVIYPRLQVTKVRAKDVHG